MKWVDDFITEQAGSRYKYIGRSPFTVLLLKRKLSLRSESRPPNLAH